jgi:hypothetical protein
MWEPQILQREYTSYRNILSGFCGENRWENASYHIMLYFIRLVHISEKLQTYII